MKCYGAIPTDSAGVAYDSKFHSALRLLELEPNPNEIPLDFSDRLDTVLDQGGANSCVAHWFSTALYLAGVTQGKPIPMPSRYWVYAMARYMSGRGRLVDSGCSARLMCWGASIHGIAAETRYPYDPQRVNDAPPFDLDLVSQDALFDTYYRAETSWEVHQALDLHHFPGVAIHVYEDFENLGAHELYDEPHGPFKGSHMVTVVGRRPGAVKIVNSWGTGWGNGGFAWLSDRYIDSPDCFDKYVVSAAPLLLR